MTRIHILAAACFAAIINVTAALPDGSYLDLDKSCLQSDESSLMQQPAVHVKAAVGKPAQRATTASEMLASARRLVEEVKERRVDFGSIALAAEGYAKIVKDDVIPSIELATTGIADLLAPRLALVKQCDFDLRAGWASKDGLLNRFGQKRSEHKACVAAETGLATQVAECYGREEGPPDVCAELSAFRAKRAAECNVIRAEMDSAACAQVSHTRDACKSYGVCRSDSMAAYEEAARSAEEQAHDRRMQMHEAKQARCITQLLAAFTGDVDSTLQQLDGCESLPLDAGVRDELPPAMDCEDEMVYSCSTGGVLELDVDLLQGQQPPVATSGVADGPPPESFAAGVSRLSRARLASWLFTMKEVAWRTLSPWQHTAATPSLISDETAVRVEGEAKGTGQTVAVLLAVPVFALAFAFCVTVATRHPSERIRSSRARAVNAPMSRNDRLIDERHSQAPVNPVHHNQAQARAQRQSSHQPREWSTEKSGLPPQPMTSLCPEFAVPAFNEVLLGVPSLIDAVPGQVMLKSIVDKSGQPLLRVGLSSTPAGDECICLATNAQQELAYCETGSDVRAKGSIARIFRWSGEPFALIREVTYAGPRNSAIDRMLPTTPGDRKTYVISSMAEPAWELLATGVVQERSLVVEDCQGQIVARLSPAASPEGGFAGDLYSLYLGPHADTCTVILALMAIDRMWGQHGALSSLHLRSSVRSSGASSRLVSSGLRQNVAMDLPAPDVGSI